MPIYDLGRVVGPQGPKGDAVLIAGETVKGNITISTTGWDIGAEEIADDVLYLDIPQEDITAEMIPFVQIHPAHEQTAKDCGMKAAARSMDGKLRLYTAKAPDSEMEATLILLKASNGPASGGGGTGSDYILPIADENTLGGIKASESVTVDEDGTAHALAEVDPGQVATDAEVTEMLSEVFGSSGAENN